MGQVLPYQGRLEDIGECCRCGIRYAVPDSFAAKRRRDHRDFYCPNGHSQHFPQESDIEKERRLRREAENKAEREQVWRHCAERSASAFKGHLTRIKRRVGKGVCPCCKRTFKNLADHMETKHPDFADEAETGGGG